MPERRLVLNHHRTGRGEPLLLLHGIGHRWQAWEPVIDLLAAHHEVIAVDLPGFGRSPVPPEGMPATMDKAVAAVRRYLEENGIERPHAAGNSLGGGIALELAAADVAASATALSPAGFFTPEEARAGLRRLTAMRASTYFPNPLLSLALRVPTVRNSSFGQIHTRPEALDHRRLVGDALSLRRGRGFRPVKRTGPSYVFLGRPSVPVTVAWAEHDRILPIAQAERARERLPEARHVTLSGCGHVPMGDDPEAVAKAILTTTGAARD
ncbi:alpha/beta fold hydrolase [Salininema proteolyticum]|uniref:Alpha/beta fold hydrolase n=1 Tax=Salininema proteolyticum TaxID=1607685 RepID=A0ABV8U510_9ACTN